MHPNFLKSFVFLSLLVLSPLAAAARTLIMPPLMVSSVAGGAMNDAGGNKQVCAATGLTRVSTDPIYAPPWGFNGVCSVWHKIFLSVYNLSNISQTVTLSLLAGSKMESLNTNGVSTGIPLLAGPGATHAGTSDIKTTTIAPLGNDTFTLFGTCNSLDCSLSVKTDSTANSVSMGGPTWNKTCPSGVPQLCIHQTMTLFMKLSVAENPGAISALVTTEANHTDGRNSVTSIAPNFPLNGGKPF